MSDHSLMNPRHLRKEIADLEFQLIPELERLVDRTHDDVRRIIDEHLAPQYNDESNDTVTLTRAQVSDIIQTLSTINMNSWRYAHAEKFALKVYRNLQKDRRWIIGSKLKFLKK